MMPQRNLRPPPARLVQPKFPHFDRHALHFKHSPLQLVHSPVLAPLTLVTQHQRSLLKQLHHHPRSQHVCIDRKHFEALDANIQACFSGSKQQTTPSVASQKMPPPSSRPHPNTLTPVRKPAAPSTIITPSAIALHSPATSISTNNVPVMTPVSKSKSPLSAPVSAPSSSVVTSVETLPPRTRAQFKKAAALSSPTSHHIISKKVAKKNIYEYLERVVPDPSSSHLASCGDGISCYTSKGTQGMGRQDRRSDSHWKSSKKKTKIK